MANFNMTWQAPEFEYREKGVAWYWVSIIVAALIIGFSVWARNFLFGFFIVVAEVLLIMWGNQVPRILPFTLTETNLHIGEEKNYILKDFENWSMLDLGGEWVEIVFMFKSKVRTPVTALIERNMTGDLRTNLKTVLKEVEHEMTVVDAIQRFLGF